MKGELAEAAILLRFYFSIFSFHSVNLRTNMKDCKGKKLFNFISFAHNDTETCPANQKKSEKKKNLIKVNGQLNSPFEKLRKGEYFVCSFLPRKMVIVTYHYANRKTFNYHVMYCPCFHQTNYSRNGFE